MLSALILSFFFETVIVASFGLTLFILVVVVAPVVEETTKGAPILLGYTHPNPFLTPVLVGFGFGATEFFVQAITGGSAFVFAPLIHMLFMVPYAILRKNPRIALLFAMFLHATWNLFVYTGGGV